MNEKEIIIEVKSTDVDKILAIANEAPTKFGAPIVNILTQIIIEYNKKKAENATNK